MSDNSIYRDGLMSPPKKFSDEVEIEICSAYLSGFSASQIANIFSCCHTTVIKILIRHGISRRTKSENSKGKKWSVKTRAKINKTLFNKYKKNGLKEMQKIAEERGGKCLSTKYVSVSNKMKCKCIKNHEWEALPLNIKKGCWCPYCANNARSNIEEMQKVAEKKMGKCLSVKYINNKTKLLWQCKEGHEWEATPNNIKRNYWCPYCTCKNEQKCRELFEKLFSVKFPKSKPEWLINPETDYRLELDGYNKELKLAFEYQGEQHYMEVKYFKVRSLRDIQKRDKLKQQLCKRKGIMLITISYNIPEKERKIYIVDKYLEFL